MGGNKIKSYFIIVGDSQPTSVCIEVFLGFYTLGVSFYYPENFFSTRALKTKNVILGSLYLTP